jgi:hypothetical protein
VQYNLADPAPLWPINTGLAQGQGITPAPEPSGNELAEVQGLTPVHKALHDGEQRPAPERKPFSWSYCGKVLHRIVYQPGTVISAVSHNPERVRWTPENAKFFITSKHSVRKSKSEIIIWHDP